MHSGSPKAPQLPGSGGCREKPEGQRGASGRGNALAPTNAGFPTLLKAPLGHFKKWHSIRFPLRREPRAIPEPLPERSGGKMEARYLPRPPHSLRRVGTGRTHSPRAAHIPHGRGDPVSIPGAPWICFDSPTPTRTVTRAAGAERGAESLRATSGASRPRWRWRRGTSRQAGRLID